MRHKRKEVTTTESGLFSHRPTWTMDARLQAAHASISIENASPTELRTYQQSVLTGLSLALKQTTIASDMGTILQRQLALLNRINTRLTELGQEVVLDSDAENLIMKATAVTPPAASAA